MKSFKTFLEEDADQIDEINFKDLSGSITSAGGHSKVKKIMGSDKIKKELEAMRARLKSSDDKKVTEARVSRAQGPTPRNRETSPSSGVAAETPGSMRSKPNTSSRGPVARAAMSRYGGGGASTYRNPSLTFEAKDAATHRADLIDKLKRSGLKGSMKKDDESKKKPYKSPMDVYREKMKQHEEAQLDEFTGADLAIAATTTKAVGAAKKKVKSAFVNKQGNNRLSVAGEADSAEAKLANKQKKDNDRERLAKAKSELLKRKQKP